MEETAAPRSAAAHPVVGARELLFLRVIGLGWLLFTTLLAFAPSSSLANLLYREGVAGMINVAFGLVEVALLAYFARGRRGTAAAMAATVAAMLSAVTLLFEVLAVVPQLRALDANVALGVLNAFLAMGVHAAFWRALTQTVRTPPVWTVVFHVTLVVTLGFWLSGLVLPFPTYRQFFIEAPWGMPMRVLRLLLAVTRYVLPILLLARMMSGRGLLDAAEGTEAPPYDGDPRSRDILVGALWLGGGLLVTVVSYALSSGGGRFLVTTGAIVYGLFRLGRGLFRR